MLYRRKYQQPKTYILGGVDIILIFAFITLTDWLVKLEVIYFMLSILFLLLPVINLYYLFIPSAIYLSSEGLTICGVLVGNIISFEKVKIIRDKITKDRFYLEYLEEAYLKKRKVTIILNEFVDVSEDVYFRQLLNEKLIEII